MSSLERLTFVGTVGGRRVEVSEFRRGQLYGRTEDGRWQAVDMADFCASNGTTPEALISRLLPIPSAAVLHAALVRNALLSAHGLSVIGRTETRRFESATRYVLDNGEGDRGVIAIDEAGAVGAASMHDVAPLPGSSVGSIVPEVRRSRAADLVHFPLLRHRPDSNEPGVTAFFWSEAGAIASSGTWLDTATFRAEVFWLEFMGQSAWRERAGSYYSAEPSHVALAIAVGDRSAPGESIRLLQSELDAIISCDSPFRAEALDELGPRFAIG